MRVKSFVQDTFELKPIEVEISLLPGLPQFQIMGLPDTAIRESQIKIKSALRQQGFSLPVRQKVLINLRPPHERKTSRGLDLAIACAFLWKTNQISLAHFEQKSPFVYGELGLDGQVYQPNDLEALFKHSVKDPILTGPIKQSLPFSFWQIKDLKDLHHPEYVPESDLKYNFKSPPLPQVSFSTKHAEILSVAALGGHSMLLAGPAGSGKSTMAEALFPLLEDPSPDVFRRSRLLNQRFGEEIQWRPFVQPHHTIPPIAMIGGGSPLFPGEISRAHGGLLLLDELLEFSAPVKEALREPIDQGEVSITRSGKKQKFPARFQLVATTNLCPCGDFVPKSMQSCRFSLKRCRSYLERLSGPILDRFEVFGLILNEKGLHCNDVISLADMKKRLEQSRQFLVKERPDHQANSLVPINELLKSTSAQVLRHLDLVSQGRLSQRRKQAILRVSRSLADLDQSHQVEVVHFERALDLAWRPFVQLRTWQ